VPGNVDVMVASELVEAGRAIQNGFVTPECTTLIASTHRVFAIAERGAMGDQRFDAERVLRAAGELAQRRAMFDMDQMARDHKSVINAVLLGAIAGTECLPIPVWRFEEAVRAHGVAVDSSLAAFHAGMDQARADQAPRVVPDEERKRGWREPDAGAARELARVEADFPEAAQDFLREGVNRLVDYQGARYAARYLDRLSAVRDAEAAAGGNGGLLRETARHLALWMSYEDVIRVAQAKTRPERFARVRREVGVADGEPLRIVEFLKPGAEEIASLLPGWLARPMLASAERGGWASRINVGLHIPSTAIWGYGVLRMLAGLRRVRPMGHRFKAEQAAIERWLDAVVRAAGVSLELAGEIAQCVRLRKGYSDTYRRGRGSFDGIMETLVWPTLDGDMAPGPATAAIRRAREAALADPEGKALAAALHPAPDVKAAAE
jgi:indolepyruvate ferredoxin oxidoreductase beta subunit